MNPQPEPTRVAHFDPDTERDMSALHASVLAMASYPLAGIDAVTIFCGMGEAERVIWAARRLHDDVFNPASFAGGIRTSCSPRFVLVTLPRESERTREESWNDNLRSQLSGMGTGPQIVVSPPQESTKTCADWVSREVKRLGIESLALATSSYNMTRAYLTLVRSLIDSRIDPVPLIPWCMPFGDIPVRELCTPEKTVFGRDMLADERDKIREYQRRGHVATLRQLHDYEDGLKRHPFFRHSLTSPHALGRM